MTSTWQIHFFFSAMWPRHKWMNLKKQQQPILLLLYLFLDYWADLQDVIIEYGRRLQWKF